jgi:hypothetical protein
MRWFGLNWLDIFINVLALAIVPGLLAAYGGHLAAEAIEDARRQRNVKMCFWFLFSFGALVTFWQQLRISQSDFARETKESWEDALATRVLFPPPSAPSASVASPVPRPDIGMEFVNPSDVAFRMVNLSREAILRDPKYAFALLDIDGPRTTLKDGTTAPDVLPIPAFADTGDFLRPGQKFLPRPIVSTFPQVQLIVKPNDRIVGSAVVSCPTCVRDRQYLVYFVNGQGGWYYEISNNPNLRVKTSELFLDPEKALEKIVPPEKRIPIGAAN